jgi:hypothetical protein
MIEGIPKPPKRAAAANIGYPTLLSFDNFSSCGGAPDTWV